VPALLAGPLMLVLAYNFGRVLSTTLNQVRDALFARVGQHAVRQLAYRTFVHLHELSLRFHLERRTGGLSRIIERGTTGIETIVRFTILNSLPTVIEFALTAGIIWYQFNVWCSSSRLPCGSMSGLRCAPATGGSPSAGR
jgi:ATP-binding cassette subfamily B protein